MRPEVLHPLFTDISNLKGIGNKTSKLVENLIGGNKLVDLIFHLPSNLIDRSYTPLLKDAIPGRVCTIKAKVIEHIAPKSRQQPYKVVVDDGSEQLTLIFFKVYPESIAKNLPLGATRIISGRLESFNGNLQMPHPDFILPLSEENKFSKFEAVYPLTSGITNKMINKYCKQALEQVPNFGEWIDPEFLKKQGWSDFKTSINQAHSPHSKNDLAPYSKEITRLAYDELLANQLALAIAREHIKKQAGRSIKGNGELRKKIIENLPFELTSAQKNVLPDPTSPCRSLSIL